MCLLQARDTPGFAPLLLGLTRHDDASVEVHMRLRLDAHSDATLRISVPANSLRCSSQQPSSSKIPFGNGGPTTSSRARLSPSLYCCCYCMICRGSTQLLTRFPTPHVAVADCARGRLCDRETRGVPDREGLVRIRVTRSGRLFATRRCSSTSLNGPTLAGIQPPGHGGATGPEAAGGGHRDNDVP